MRSTGNSNIKRLEFSIEHTDRKALELIKEKLAITSNIFNRAKRSQNRQETFILQVSSKENINSIIKLCDSPLLNKLEGNKLIQFNNWKIWKKD